MLFCEILLKISKLLKFCLVKTIFTFFVFATWVSVFMEHVQSCFAQNGPKMFFYAFLKMFVTSFTWK